MVRRWVVVSFPFSVQVLENAREHLPAGDVEVIRLARVREDRPRDLVGVTLVLDLAKDVPHDVRTLDERWENGSPGPSRNC